LLEAKKVFLKINIQFYGYHALIKKLFAEIVANKEKNETSKRHVMITDGDKE